jgi:glycosyltransferase involved in cell wall biosynthesis
MMKETWKNNLGLKIVSLLFAVILWWTVMNIDDPVDTKTFRTEVQILHPEVITDNGYSYRIDEEMKTIEVKVKARSKVLSQIRAVNVLATADLREMQDTTVPIRVSVNGFENMYEEAHPSTTLQWIKHIFSADNILTAVKEYDAEAVILYNLPVVTLLSVKIALRKTNVKVMYDCTEWTAYTDGGLPKRLFKKFDEFFVRNFLHKLCGNLIVISSKMQEKYRESKNMILLPPLVDTEDEIWHQKTGRNDDCFEFCFAGVPDGNKESLDSIVSAFSETESKKARLRIIGVTKEHFVSLYPSLKKAAEDERIVFMGRLSHKETLKYVADCDCYIFIRPSDRRNNAGFPTKFAEGYTLNVPVITTDISDIAKYLDIQRDILLPDCTVLSVQNAMETKIREGKLTASKGIRNTFDYRNYVDSCKKLLK